MKWHYGMLLGSWALLAGCGAGVGGEHCARSTTCAGGGTIDACCSSTQCRYRTSDNSEFVCSGINCTAGSPSAAQQVATWCQSH